MKNGIIIIAHAPLASALHQCLAHVFPDRVDDVLAIDVQADVPVPQSARAVCQAAKRFEGAPLLLLTDMNGATPCNVGRQVLESLPGQLVAGVNLPMLLRAVTYQQEPIAVLAARAVSGGTQGVVQVVPAVA